MNTVDTLWILICIFALLFMQVGFCCLEAGYVRSKNNINVVIKNSIDLALTLLVFALIGYGIMFGSTFAGLIGIPSSPISPDSPISGKDPELILRFLFYSLFCATTVTIVSGAAAERISFHGYLIFSIFMGGLLFPVIAHWVWFQDPSADTSGWLKQFGFVDFAGATVVHSVGGWAALAMTLYLGPRTGRFEEKTVHPLSGKEESSPFRPENVPMIAIGTLLLWVAWLGFNGGSERALTNRIPLILANTLLAGSAAIVTGALAHFIQKRKPDVLVMMNCGLGGLVASTAACNLMTPGQAILLGIASGLVFMATDHLLKYMKLDDAVGAIPVHLACGILGTLSVAFVLPETSSTWLSLLTTQFIGVITVCAATFTACWFFLSLTGIFLSYRVSKESEMVGLNISEHDARTPMVDVLIQMSQHAVHSDFKLPIPVSSHSEAGHIASFYNTLLQKLDFAEDQKKRKEKLLSSNQQQDPLTLCQHRNSWIKELTMALFENTQGRLFAACLLDINNFHKVNDDIGCTAGDALLLHMGSTLKAMTGINASIGRIEKDRFGIILPDTSLEQVEAITERICREINSSPFIYSDHKIDFTVRYSTAAPQTGEQADHLLERLLIGLKENKTEKLADI